ncbi:Metal-dependent hydrolase, beta-lactamase superfamily II [Mucilaginibacter pineti]|uniref:Metal-dependent hydrolase, beta-lactamase superfamily II n=1 Tax=Mucilaginibacter pineti TaxID=1391627 RepID=A0A1G7CQT9_9SPHI|nr:MBL fold metallo-hydrolase [Mucilaginibacter pineti]SDE41669.1 Metal-dependent hydrolase, beta-lactamase superfamily II [Mucilaginibacter pineti]
MKILGKLFIWFILLLPTAAFAAAPAADFVMWQLPSQVNTHGNSYVFKLKNGSVFVIDGGTKDETPYLRGFLAALGNRVEGWFISHPHFDHMGALNEILKKPGDIKIANIYHAALSEGYIDAEPEYTSQTREFYGNLKASGINITDVKKAGFTVRSGKTRFKILSEKDEAIAVNPYNNQSMVIRVWDPKKSIVFLGDLGIEGGEKLLNGKYRPDLDCDYLQMAHHGQKGVSKQFYRSIKFRACLWPTPLWLWNNDGGRGYNTHTFETVEIRALMDELGIKRHYIAWQGLAKIE